MPTITVYPSSVNTTDYSYQSVNSSYPLANMVGKSYLNSSYAEWYLKTGSQAESWVYYNFDLSSIPAGSTINSVACTPKAYVSNTNANYIAIRTIQLYSGSTAKGSPSTVVQAASTYTLTTGSWTRDELQSCRLKIYSKRGTSNTTTTYSNRFYGADLTVDYTVPATPAITVGTPSKTKISDETGCDQATCTFQSDIALSAWEARATASGTTPARGVGLLVESGTTLAAATNATVTVDNEELTSGDSDYTVTVYGHATNGMWSDGTYEA